MQKHGLKVYLRNPNSYTPMLEPAGSTGRPRSLILGRDAQENSRQIAQFSEKDAKVSKHSFSLFFKLLYLVVLHENTHIRDVTGQKHSLFTIFHLP